MEQDHDVDSHRDEERLQRDVETQNVSVNGQEERSECISILRQLLDDVDMNIVSKYSLIKQLEEECGEELKMVVKVMYSLSSEYQAISEEIDAYIFTHRQSQSSSVSSNTSLDSFFLVEPALAKITGKQECSGKEVGIQILEQSNRFSFMSGSTFMITIESEKMNLKSLI